MGDRGTGRVEKGKEEEEEETEEEEGEEEEEEEEKKEGEEEEEEDFKSDGENEVESERSDDEVNKCMKNAKGITQTLNCFSITCNKLMANKKDFVSARGFGGLKN